MSTPVVTDKWAGTFDCSVCQRKRLVGDEFSKKALEKHRKMGGPMKCKKCVAENEEVERAAAAAKKPACAASDETRQCAKCSKQLTSDAFNKNQWNKGEGKARCRSCVEKSLAEEAAQQKQSKRDKIQKARDDVERAKVSGNAQDVLKAESVLSALEAEKVTGLKPVKMGRGRGRGRGSAGRSGRGRSGRR